MTERPILFNAEMVKAILEGRKTQTRRVIKLDHERGMVNPVVRGKDGETSYVGCRLAPMLCPIGQPGDRLWVRETWGVVSHAFDENDLMVDWIPDRPAKKIHELPFGNGYYSGHVIYRADGGFSWCEDDTSTLDEKSCWKPSIHMPRAASRIQLEITDIRVERLQDISQIDAIAEGGPPSHPSIDAASRSFGFPDFSRSWFAQTWQSIYGTESWEVNPWVWVIEFKRVGGPHETLA